MSDEIINQAIESAQVVQTTTPTTEQPVDTEIAQEEATPELKEPDDVPFPKKAINAMSRRDKQIGKLQAQLAAERRELLKYREQQAKFPQAADNAPDESKFENYGDFLEAKILHKFQKEQGESQKKQQEAQFTEQRQAWVAERAQAIDSQAEELTKIAPDFANVIGEYAQDIADAPESIRMAFLEADNANLAFYALAKEGKLEAVLGMSPFRAAIEIGKAETRGEAMLKNKPATKAPAPIQGLKGTGVANKSLSQMTVEERIKWVNS